MRARTPVDLVVIRLPDAAAADFLSAPEALRSALGAAGLVLVSSSSEDEFVALMLQLIFAAHVPRQDDIARAALRTGLLEAGCVHAAAFEPVLSVYARPAAAAQAPGPDAIRARLNDVFADAVDGFERLPSATDLTTLGISSMTWVFIAARMADAFGPGVDVQRLLADGTQAPSIDSIVAMLAGQPVPPASASPAGDLAARVWARVPARVQVDLPAQALLSRGVFRSGRGQQIEYYACGSGPAIVFLTALAFSKSVWEHQIAALSGSHRLIFPHLPGHAGSRFEGVNFSFEDVADDLAQLLDHLDVPAAHLAGWCMAGNIAQIFALRHPDRLKSLVLICTTPTGARLRGLTQADLEEYSASPLNSYRYEFQNIYRESAFSARIGAYLSVIEQAHVPVDQGALLCLMMGLFRFNTVQRLGEIAVPTLIFSGAYDIAFPSDQVALLKRGIAHAHFVEFERGGHLPFLNESDVFNARLTEFLALVEDDAGALNDKEDCL